ncbi:MAG TPA: hypothetical protein VEA40_14410 [Ramlibacter sp.]|nr:hypothetical protein [Ramlibacter sp.]
MRRGWMDWVPQEVPEAFLKERVGRVAAACAQQDVQALVLFSSFTRPAQVSALTHFVPFWRQALLVVTRDARTLLTMATTGRTVQWMRSSSCVDEVLVGPDIGRTAGTWLAQRGQAERVGVANLDDVPRPALDSLRAALPQAQVLDATGWYAPLEAGFGPAPAVARRCLEIARGALEQVTEQAHRSPHDIVAAVEGHARSEGAEEAMVWLAPDLATGAEAYRLEGPAQLGDSFAVQLTLAYKGCWVRVAGSFARSGDRIQELPASARARQALRQAAAGTLAADLLRTVSQAAEAEVVSWSAEAPRGGLPLACVAASDLPGLLPARATFSARLASAGLRILVAEPTSP